MGRRSAQDCAGAHRIAQASEVRGESAAQDRPGDEGQAQPMLVRARGHCASLGGGRAPITHAGEGFVRHGAAAPSVACSQRMGTAAGPPAAT